MKLVPFVPFSFDLFSLSFSFSQFLPFSVSPFLSSSFSFSFYFLLFLMIAFLFLATIFADLSSLSTSDSFSFSSNSNFFLPLTHYSLSLSLSLLDPVHNLTGEVLTILRVTRVHMGALLCIASNGIQPSVSRRVFLRVQCKFFPLSLSFSLFRFPLTLNLMSLFLNFSPFNFYFFFSSNGFIFFLLCSSSFHSLS